MEAIKNQVKLSKLYKTVSSISGEDLLKMSKLKRLRFFLKEVPMAGLNDTKDSIVKTWKQNKMKIVKPTLIGVGGLLCLDYMNHIVEGMNFGVATKLIVSAVGETVGLSVAIWVLFALYFSLFTERIHKRESNKKEQKVVKVKQERKRTKFEMFIGKQGMKFANLIDSNIKLSVVLLVAFVLTTSVYVNMNYDMLILDGHTVYLNK
ncbi:hypothetical protein ACQUY5_28330 [Bacillus cereus]|uniref:hypothetical protein n=1 Tax=Bacillus cereus TaxID=1396 RepID=UPI003D1637F0